MPVLNGPLTPDGEAMVEVEIAVPLAFARSLRGRGLTPAAPRVAPAVIDTGATMTCVDTQVLQVLRLAPSHTLPILTASSGSEGRGWAGPVASRPARLSVL